MEKAIKKLGYSVNSTMKKMEKMRGGKEEKGIRWSNLKPLYKDRKDNFTS